MNGSKKKRILPIMLVLAVVLALAAFITGYPATVFAAGGGTAPANPHDAIGIDPSKAPDGYEQNAPNPYGRNTTVLNTVSEFYELGTTTWDGLTTHETDATLTASDPVKQTDIADKLQGVLFGHEVYGATAAADIVNSAASRLETSIASGLTTLTGTYNVAGAATPNAFLADRQVNPLLESEGGGHELNVVLSRVVGGNFDGNTEGKKAQAVMLYTTELSKNGGLYFSVGEIVDGKYGAPKELISTSKEIGNTTTQQENFSQFPYALQNYIQVACGDFDGCGRDEIAVYIPEQGKSRIEVYKLITTSSSGPDNYLNPQEWKLEWTYSLNEGNYVSNMVSLVTGDFTRDGVDDLAATWGYYYGPNENRGSTAVVLFGSRSGMLQRSQEFPLKHGGADIVRGAFTYGDLMGGGDKVLVLGGQSDTDLKTNRLYTRYVAFYEWDGNNFVTNDSLYKNFDLFEKDNDGNYVHDAMSRTTGEIFYSTPLCVSNLAVKRNGPGVNSVLYFDSLLIEYSDAGLNIIATLDNKAQMQSNAGSPVAYVEYGAVSGDVVGLGEDMVATMSQTFGYEEEHTLRKTVSAGTYWVWEKTSSYYYNSWWDQLWGKRTYIWAWIEHIYPDIEISEDVAEFIPGKAYLTRLYDNTYSRAEKCPSTSVCMPITDNKSTFVNYNAVHYFTYSDPNVLAVLASPPYFSDLLGRDDLSGNYAESSTTYSTTEGSGTGITASATISAGAYVKVEQEFSIFGIKVGQAEAEASVLASFTYAYEQSSILEQTVTYTATSGEDMIALYAIPLEIFEFTAYVPDGKGGYDEQIMAVNIPHTAAVKLLSLDEYEGIAEDFQGFLPTVAQNILTHTVGDPSSYPSSITGYKKAIAYNGAPAALGYSSTAGGSTITQEIAMTSDTTNSFSGSVAIEARAGGGAGGVTVGVILGAEGGAGYATISTSGNSFSGELQNMPIEAEPFGYYHNWRIFCYEYSDGRISFPVVNYLINDVSMPPPLPDDFAQDIGGTTSDKIELSWSYSASRTIAGFQLYRYYEFPDGSGSYELAFIPYSGGTLGADGRMYFSYIDEKLYPYTEYNYQIQSVRAAVPNKSIYSEPVSARTKTDRGYPIITLSGLNEDGFLPIYPDTPSSVTVSVKDPDTNAIPENINYQWQKYVGSNWVDIGGAVDTRLTFNAAGSGDEALYRCRVNTVYFDKIGGNTYYISAYSNIFPAKYYKRTPRVADEGFNVLVNGHDLKISIELISAEAGHNTAPDGTVTFTVTGLDGGYSKSVTAELKEGSSGSGKIPATATVDLKNLPEGIYDVTAVYSGSRIFKSLICPETKTVGIGSAEGYRIILTNQNKVAGVSFTYGDEMYANIYHLSQQPSGEMKMTLANDPGFIYVVYDVTDTLSLWGFDAAADARVKHRDPQEDRPFHIGTYVIEAWRSDSGLAECFISSTFTVSPLNITVYQEAHTVTSGAVSYNPPQNYIMLDAATPMAPGETLETLELTFEAKNSAGNLVTIDDDTLPGNYTVLPCASDTTPLDKYANYNITFISNIYTIVGQSYPVTYSAVDYAGNKVGVINLTNISAEGNNFPAGTELLFMAEPDRGYAVNTWTVTEKNGNTPVGGQQGSLSFTHVMKSEPIDITVTFKLSNPTLTVEANPPFGGTISCSSTNFKSGDAVRVDAEMEFTATPNTGYHFVRWLIYAGTSYAKEVFGETLPFTMSSYETRIYSEFERDSYTLTLSGNIEAVYTDALGTNRTVTGSANIPGDTVITVRPRKGYQIPIDAEWQVTGSSGSVGADNQSYTFTILEPTHIYADTENMTYNVEAIYNDSEGRVSFSINGVDAADDTVTGVAGGSQIVFIAVPQYGYVFDYWEINGADAGTTRILNINQLGEDIVAVANFLPAREYTATVELSSDRASIYYSVTDELGRVIYDDEGGFDILDLTLYKGDTLTVRIAPEQDFMVGKWEVNGKDVHTSLKTQVFEDISGDLDIRVVITPAVFKRVYYEAGPNGDIRATSDGYYFAPSFDEPNVGGGTTVVFTAPPDSGYMVEGWTVNNDDLLNKYGEPFVGEEYIIDGLGEDIDLFVWFTEEVIHDVSVTTHKAAYDVTYSPDGRPRDGASAVFTFTPKPGCSLTSATVNGDAFDEVAKHDDGSWVCTIYNIRQDLDVEATALSSDATLKELYLDGFDLNEKFCRWVTEYTANVPEGTEAVTVNAVTSRDSGASVVISGDDGLSPGPNTVIITVTAEDGTAKTYYTITVYVASSGKVLISVTTPPAVSGVANGADKTEEGLGLPATVTLDTTGGNVSASVTWDVASCDYDPDDTAAQTFDVDGVVKLPSDVINPNNNVTLSVSVKVSVNAAQASTRTLQSVTQPQAVTGVANGAAKTAAGLGLPATVTLVTSNGNVSASVNWYVASCSYDPNNTAAQTFDVSGVVQLPWGVIKPDNVSLQVSVSVSVNAGGGGSRGGSSDTPATPPPTVVPTPNIPLTQITSFDAFIQGYTDGNFHGNAPITREQFVAILYRLRGNNASVANNVQSFNDVTSARWSFTDIEWAKGAGIITPDADGGFKPAEPLARADMAVMIVKCFGLEESTENIFSDLNGHKDIDYILKAVKAGIFNGYPDGTFRPEGSSTRAEAVTALIRYLLAGEPTEQMLAGRQAPFADVPQNHWAHDYIVMAVYGYTKTT